MVQAPDKLDGFNEPEVAYSGGMDDGKRTAYERRNPRGLKGDGGESSDSDDSSDDEEKGLVAGSLDVLMEEECVP